jgi:hypothetical protein
MTPGEEPDGLRLTAAEEASRRRRNRAIGLAVAALCLLFYAITVFKMGPAILSRPM